MTVNSPVPEPVGWWPFANSTPIAFASTSVVTVAAIGFFAAVSPAFLYCL